MMGIMAAVYTNIAFYQQILTVFYLKKLSEGEYDREVYLGEIEGKHSEAYGDLEVEFVNLNDLSPLEVSNLINGSYVGEFECYLEGIEDDFSQEEDEDNSSYDEDLIKNVLNEYNIEFDSYGIKSIKVYDVFIERLKLEYIKPFKTITVEESDYDVAVTVLENKGIKSY